MVKNCFKNQPQYKEQDLIKKIQHFKGHIH